MPQVFLGQMSKLKASSLAFLSQESSLLEKSKDMNEKRLVSYLSGRALLKYALIKAHVITPDALLPQISYRELGKPYFSNKLNPQESFYQSFIDSSHVPSCAASYDASYSANGSALGSASCDANSISSFYSSALVSDSSPNDLLASATKEDSLSTSSEASSSELNFNIAHSDDFIALALGLGDQGLDLERVRPRKIKDELARRVLNDDEYLFFKALRKIDECKESITHEAGEDASADVASAKAKSIVKTSNDANADFCTKEALPYVLSRHFFTRQWSIKECIAKVKGGSIFDNLSSLKLDPFSHTIVDDKLPAGLVVTYALDFAAIAKAVDASLAETGEPCAKGALTNDAIAEDDAANGSKTNYAQGDASKGAKANFVRGDVERDVMDYAGSKSGKASVAFAASERESLAALSPFSYLDEIRINEKGLCSLLALNQLDITQVKRVLAFMIDEEPTAASIFKKDDAKTLAMALDLVNICTNLSKICDVLGTLGALNDGSLGKELDRLLGRITNIDASLSSSKARSHLNDVVQLLLGLLDKILEASDANFCSKSVKNSGFWQALVQNDKIYDGDNAINYGSDAHCLGNNATNVSAYLSVFVPLYVLKSKAFVSQNSISFTENRDILTRARDLFSSSRKFLLKDYLEFHVLSSNLLNEVALHRSDVALGKDSLECSISSKSEDAISNIKRSRAQDLGLSSLDASLVSETVRFKDQTNIQVQSDESSVHGKCAEFLLSLKTPVYLPLSNGSRDPLLVTFSPCCFSNVNL